MDYKAWYSLPVDPAGYYADIAKAAGRDPQATARTRNADGTIPIQAQDLLFNISAEIKNYFHEFGAPMPPLMEGCTVLDLCCGSGRDAYLAAQLVGCDGCVIGIEPDAKRLAIGQKYADQERKQFGYRESNVQLINGFPEDLSAIPDASVDIVISNCTFNLSCDKDAYAREVHRVLKDNGEWYFTDVFTDRRIPLELAQDIEKRAIRLGGAMYINDFRRIVQAAGFNDPRYPFTFKTPMTEREQEMFEGIAFATITCRLLKSEWTEDACESFGETITYKGNLPDHPDFFPFDHAIRFPAGEPRTVCNNVSALMHTRYAVAFDYEGSRDVHLGDTHGDCIIKTAPSYEGIIDEDDQPIKASCC